MHRQPKANTIKRHIFVYHAIALLIVIIWGTTFVSTKVLISEGISPTEIFIYRFALAYLCIILVSHVRLWASNAKDEILLAMAGLTGGSLYFIAENSALGITFASDVSLIICTAPIFTLVFSKVFLHVPLRSVTLIGSIISLLGVGLVVFNGAFNLGLNPWGDILTLIAAMLWAAYCGILKVIGDKYPVLFITRKVFFYGLVSAIVIFIFKPTGCGFEALFHPIVIANLLFLGIVASMLCYIMWNSAVKILGAEKTANYIYFVPLVTILAAAIILSEPITWFTVVGAILIIGGVYTAEQ